MPLIVKPISAQLTKDGDFFGKAVIIRVILGPLLCGHDWARKAEDCQAQWRRKNS